MHRYKVTNFDSLRSWIQFIHTTHRKILFSLHVWKKRKMEEINCKKQHEGSRDPANNDNSLRRVGELKSSKTASPPRPPPFTSSRSCFHLSRVRGDGYSRNDGGGSEGGKEGDFLWQKKETFRALLGTGEPLFSRRYHQQLWKRCVGTSKQMKNASQEIGKPWRMFFFLIHFLRRIWKESPGNRQVLSGSERWLEWRDGHL